MAKREKKYLKIKSLDSSAAYHIEPTVVNIKKASTVVGKAHSVILQNLLFKKATERN